MIIPTALILVAVTDASLLSLIKQWTITLLLKPSHFCWEIIKYNPFYLLSSFLLILTLFHCSSLWVEHFFLFEAWLVNSIKGFEYRISTAYKITFLIMESLLWSYLELLKIIRYFNQNMMGLGGKCGCHDQGCGLMVRATISYCITLFLAPHIDWLLLIFVIVSLSGMWLTLFYFVNYFSIAWFRKEMLVV